MLPLHSNTLSSYPAPPSGLDGRDWARLLHQDRVTEFARSLDGEGGRPSLLVVQFAPATPAEKDPIEVAGGKDHGSYFVSKFAGHDGFQLYADRLVRTFGTRVSGGEVSVYSDGRFEFGSAKIEGSKTGEAHPILMPGWAYAHLMHAHWCARDLYERVESGGPFFLDWTLWPRAGVEIYAEGRDSPPPSDGRPSGQSMKLGSLFPMSHVVASAVCRVAGLRGVPDSWQQLIQD